jgi:protein-S-isoprenylcysteine O-methyltransferase Ste14
LYKIGNFLFKRRGIIIFFIFLFFIFFSKPNFFKIVISIPFIILGESIRIYSLIYSGGFTRRSELNAPYLLKEGPYSLVRNPIYFGNLVNLIGIIVAMNLNFILSLVLFFLIFLIYFLIILSEEKFLEKRFGEEYIIYKKNVPRILPNPFKFKKGKPLNKFKDVLRFERDTIFSILIFYALMILILWKRNF